jgi:hypothetical protein
VRTICVLLLAALALTAVLAACDGGGSDDRAKVEASLQDYLNTIDPQACLGARLCGQGAFPYGAGAPQVRENSCKKTHTGRIRPPRGRIRPALPEGLTFWSCVITFPPGKTALPVAVAVKRSGEVYFAAPVGGPALPPATVYEGGS